MRKRGTRLLAVVGAGLLAGCSQTNPFNEPLLNLYPNLTLKVTNRSGLDDVNVVVDGPCRDLGAFVLDQGQSAREGCQGSIGSTKVSVRATQAAAGYDDGWEFEPTPDQSNQGLDFKVDLTPEGIHVVVY
jgi:hypothetical protein